MNRPGTHLSKTELRLFPFMTLVNTSHRQDTALTQCEEFGGPALIAAEAAKELDQKLCEAQARIIELEGEIQNRA